MGSRTRAARGADFTSSADLSFELDIRKHSWEKPDNLTRPSLHPAMAQKPRPKFDLKKFVDTIPAIAWSGRTLSSPNFWNKRWHEYTGLSAEEYIRSLPVGMKRFTRKTVSRLFG